VLPPLITTLLYFPIWQKQGGACALSGFVLLLILLALIPLFNLIKSYLASPAAYTLWLLVFIVFFLLSNIAYEMTVISFVGFVGNVIGAVLLRLGGVRRAPRNNENDTR